MSKSSTHLMSLRVTILGCGSSSGVPRPALGWGACDPLNPKNRRRRCSILVEKSGADGKTRVLVDTSPDLREQTAVDRRRLARCRVHHPRACRPHPRRRRSAQFLPAPETPASTSISTSRPRKVMFHRFNYCFVTQPGSNYPPIANEHRIYAGPRRSPLTAPAAPITVMPFLQDHGDIASLGLPVWQAGVFERRQRTAGRKPAGAEGPRCLDHRRLALSATSEPFQRRRRAELDQADGAQARHPDQHAFRSGLRGTARAAAGKRRAGL